MLDKKVFITGMKMLKACYLKWDFNPTDTYQAGMWYTRLSGLDDEDFKAIINIYTQTKVYPPQSPAEILSAMEEQIASREVSADDAYAFFVDCVRRCCGFQIEYPDNMDNVYSMIRKYKVLYNTVNQLQEELMGADYSDTFLAGSFKKAYAENMRREVKDKMKKVACIGTFVPMIERGSDDGK